MEEKSQVFETLIERATDYGKTNLELLKLKAVDKTSDVVSTVIPDSFVFVMIATFMLLVAVIHFFLHKWIKKVISNFIIKQLLK
jgi:hypothetical protein